MEKYAQVQNTALSHIPFSFILQIVHKKKFSTKYSQIFQKTC